MANFAAVKQYYLARKSIPEADLPYHREYLSLLAQHLMTASWRPTNSEGNKQNRSDFADALRCYLDRPDAPFVPYVAIQQAFAMTGYDRILRQQPAGPILRHPQELLASLAILHKKLIRGKNPDMHLDDFLREFSRQCELERRRCREFITAYDGVLKLVTDKE